MTRTREKTAVLAVAVTGTMAIVVAVWFMALRSPETPTRENVQAPRALALDAAEESASLVEQVPSQEPVPLAPSEVLEVWLETDAGGSILPFAQVPPYGFLPTGLSSMEFLVLPLSSGDHHRLSLVGSRIILDGDVKGFTVLKGDLASVLAIDPGQQDRPQVLLLRESVLDAGLLKEIRPHLADDYFLVLQDCVVASLASAGPDVLAGLKGLVLIDGTVAPSFWRDLHSLAHLEALGLSGQAFGDPHLETLSALPSLTHLQLVLPFATHRGVEKLAGLKKLRYLALSKRTWTKRETLAALGHLEELRSLGLEGGMERDGLSALAFLDHLQGLHLASNQKTTEDMFRSIAAMSQLRVLHIASPSNGAFFVQLSALTGLSSLILRLDDVVPEQLTWLQNLPRLRTLWLVGASAFTDTNTLVLEGRLPQVDRLLVDAGRLSDAGLSALLQGQSPEVLVLGVPQASAVPLGRLTSLDRLRFLDMRGLTPGDGGLQAIAACKKLETLLLAGSGYGESGVQQLQNVASLRRLYLDSTTLGAESLVPLGDMPNLEMVAFPQNVLFDEASDWLSGLTGLRGFSCTGTTCRGGVLRHLGGMKHLEWLNLSGSAVNGEAFGDLAGLENLAYVELGGSALTDAGVAALARLPGLIYAGVSRTAISDDGLAALGAARNLRVLNMEGCVLDGTGFSRWEAPGHLAILDASDSQLGDAGMEGLARFEGLTSFRANGSRVGERGLAYLASVPRLLDLQFMNTRIRGEFFDQPGTFPALRSLRAAETQLEDVALNGLSRSNTLVRLDVSRTEITSAGIAELARIPTIVAIGAENLPVAADDIRALGKAPELTILTLPCVVWTNDSLKALASLDRIESLNITGDCSESDRTPTITDDMLGNLSGMTSLWFLLLDMQRLTGDGFAQLKGVPNLQRLTVSDNPISDNGLRVILENLPLISVFLVRTAITDASLDRIVAHRTLIAAVLHQTGLTVEGVKRLRTDAPWMDVRSLDGLVGDENGASQ